MSQNARAGLPAYDKISQMAEDVFEILDKHDVGVDVQIGVLMVAIGSLLSQYDNGEKPFAVQAVRQGIERIAYEAEIE